MQVTIPAAQLARSGGHGPAPRDDAAWIDAGTLVSPLSARLLAGCAPGWDRLFADPQTGEVVASDRYRPSAQQRRELVGRDTTCRFPGCATLARRADIDHTRDWARGGETEVDNLAVLCEAHHRMKHVSGWSAVQRPGGVIAWTSPAGHETEAAPHGAAFRASTRGASGLRPQRSGGARRPAAQDRRTTSAAPSGSIRKTSAPNTPPSICSRPTISVSSRSPTRSHAATSRIRPPTGGATGEARPQSSATTSTLKPVVLSSQQA